MGRKKVRHKAGPTPYPQSEYRGSEARFKGLNTTFRVTERRGRLDWCRQPKDLAIPGGSRRLLRLT